MSKKVFTAAIRSNETKTLRIVEPLHCTGWHFCVQI
jgi:hypothetical protein